MQAKKISADALHFALILALVRLGPEILLNNQVNEALVVSETYLGATLGYRRFSSLNNYALSNRYVNLKTLDSLIMDRSASLRDQLSHLRNYGEYRNDIYAYYNEQNAEKPSSTSNGTVANDSSTGHPQQDSALDSHHVGSRRSPVEPYENLHGSSIVELSPEDMDLIEILWKQDIDLGVSREAFSFHDNHQVEKTKGETALSKPEEVSLKPLVNASSDSPQEKGLDFDGENSTFYNQWEGLNYTVDNETGEFVIQDQKLDESDHNSSGELSLFNGDGFGNLSRSLFRAENDSADFDFTKLPLDDDEVLQQPLDNFLPNLEDLFAEVEKLEESLVKTEDGCDLTEGSEMYPSMEEYWQDISTTLPLSVMGSSYPGTVPIIPRPVRAYPPPSSENHTELPSSSSELLPRTNDNFQGALLQNATLTSRASDINSTFGYLPSALGPTSLGCAVASSIATLTNDTDPMPDVSGVLNGTYGLDLPSVLHPNQTSVVATTNESLISDFLMVEELQLMDTAAASSVPTSDDVSCHTLAIPNDNMELSSDSVASSMSGNMSSVSDHSSSKRVNLENLSAVEYVGKESVYTSLKYPLHPPYTSPGYRQMEGSTSSHTFGFSSSSYRNDYSHYMQHNHSYHLPFTNCNASPKPVTRDKSKSSSSDDDTHNRDEKRAKALKLPISIDDIINLGIDEFNEKLSKFELTEPQLTLIRDIRRRGKNKVAAQNCRKRKMDQISNLQQALDFLDTERLQLESERAQLLHQRRNVRDKYSQLCHFVIQSTNPRNPVPSVFPSNVTTANNNATFAGSNPTTSDSSKSEDTIFNQGVRAKRKVEKKRLDFP